MDNKRVYTTKRKSIPGKTVVIRTNSITLTENEKNKALLWVTLFKEEKGVKLKEGVASTVVNKGDTSSKMKL